MEEKKEITLEVKNLEDRTWKSGCLTIDRKAVVFFATLGISLIVIAFTGVFMITYGKNTFKKRGWKLAVAGILIPLLVLIFVG